MSKVGINSVALGIKIYQDALDITANNIANVNTDGFKASRASFSDLIYTSVNQKNQYHQEGHGVRINKTDLMFEQSTLQDTGRALDFAALNEGFFAVQTDGETLFTKAGSFKISQNAAGDCELCDANGGFVLDADGNHITVPYNEETDEYDLSGVAAKVAIYRFPNPYGLDQTGNNYYEQNDSSGDAFVDPDAVLKQGYLEKSSTNVANEMSKVIEYQRSFQLNVTLFKQHDEMNAAMNNLRN